MSDGLLDINNFLLLKKIGSSSFNELYIVKEKNKNEELAAKVSLQSYDDTNSLKPLKEKIIHCMNKFKNLNHPSILKYIGYSPIDFHNENKPVIIMQFMPMKSLEEILKRGNNSGMSSFLNDSQKLINIYGIASAMSCLHSYNIVHGCLYPSNILIDFHIFPKISDFQPFNLHDSSQNIIDTKTAIYTAPELCGNLNYTKEGDVYAFGMIIYEIISNERPFKNLNYFEILTKVSSGNRPEIPSTVSSSFSKLIQKCWSQNPSDRPTFEEITNILRNDPSLCMNLMDKRDYENYIDYLEEYQNVYKKSHKCISIEEFIASKMTIFDSVNKFVYEEPEEQDDFQNEKVESINQQNVLFQQANRNEKTEPIPLLFNNPKKLFDVPEPSKPAYLSKPPIATEKMVNNNNGNFHNLFDSEAQTKPINSNNQTEQKDKIKKKKNSFGLLDSDDLKEKRDLFKQPDKKKQLNLFNQEDQIEKSDSFNQPKQKEKNDINQKQLKKKSFGLFDSDDEDFKTNSDKITSQIPKSDLSKQPAKNKPFNLFDSDNDDMIIKQNKTNNDSESENSSKSNKIDLDATSYMLDLPKKKKSVGLFDSEEQIETINSTKTSKTKEQASSTKQPNKSINLFDSDDFVEQNKQTKKNEVNNSSKSNKIDLDDTSDMLDLPKKKKSVGLFDSEEQIETINSTKTSKTKEQTFSTKQPNKSINLFDSDDEIKPNNQTKQKDLNKVEIQNESSKVTRKASLDNSSDIFDLSKKRKSAKLFDPEDSKEQSKKQTQKPTNKKPVILFDSDDLIDQSKFNKQTDQIEKNDVFESENSNKTSKIDLDESLNLPEKKKPFDLFDSEKVIETTKSKEQNNPSQQQKIKPTNLFDLDDEIVPLKQNQKTNKIDLDNPVDLPKKRKSVDLFDSEDPKETALKQKITVQQPSKSTNLFDSDDGIELNKKVRPNETDNSSKSNKIDLDDSADLLDLPKKKKPVGLFDSEEQIDTNNSISTASKDSSTQQHSKNKSFNLFDADDEVDKNKKVKSNEVNNSSKSNKIDLDNSDDVFDIPKKKKPFALFDSEEQKETIISTKTTKTNEHNPSTKQPNKSVNLFDSDNDTELIKQNQKSNKIDLDDPLDLLDLSKKKKSVGLFDAEDQNEIIGSGKNMKTKELNTSTHQPNKPINLLDPDYEIKPNNKQIRSTKQSDDQNLFSGLFEPHKKKSLFDTEYKRPSFNTSLFGYGQQNKKKSSSLFDTENQNKVTSQFEQPKKKISLFDSFDRDKNLYKLEKTNNSNGITNLDDLNRPVDLFEISNENRKTKQIKSKQAVNLLEYPNQKREPPSQNNSDDLFESQKEKKQTFLFE